MGPGDKFRVQCEGGKEISQQPGYNSPRSAGLIKWLFNRLALLWFFNKSQLSQWRPGDLQVAAQFSLPIKSRVETKNPLCFQSLGVSCWGVIFFFFFAEGGRPEKRRMFLKQ